MRLRRRGTNPETSPDDVRMTLGEHLEELRTRVLRSVIALGVGAVLCYLFVDYIEAFMTAGLYRVLREHGYPSEIVYNGVTETFVTDFQLALVLGLIVTAPYILTQLWGFVAAGLYPNERRWVRRFVPVSIGLFFVGALFFLTVVTPLFLNFFVSYKTELPDVSAYVGWLVPKGTPPMTTSQPAAAHWPATGDTGQGVPAFAGDPDNPPEGKYWLNETEHEIRIRFGDKTYIANRLREATSRNRINPMITMQDYIIFILEMAAAFGGGFQVPVVVALLATIGIVSAADMARMRRYIYFGIGVAAAFITPTPDVATMLLLFVPMAALFEAGLVTARFIERERARENAAS